MSGIELDLSGWVLEKPKISESNSPNTTPPDNMTLAGFSPTVRADYMVAALNNSRLREARFAWVKNAGRDRFGFGDADRRWMPLYGKAPVSLGVISNNPRLVLTGIPTGSPPYPFPFRLYVTNPSNSVFDIYTKVPTSGDFTDPTLLPAGTVEIEEENLTFHKPI
jgi:hypothetical protein